MKIIKNTTHLKNNHYHADYICFCGERFTTRISNIKNNKQKSCGCLRSTKQGDSSTRLYRIHADMKSRCYNKKDTGFKWYGLHGIKICKEWLEDYNNFRDWALSNGYSDNLSIDRIEVTGNYEPSNCRWATNTEQARNKKILQSNTSGYIGVSFEKRRNSYRTYVNIDNIQVFIGSFKTAKEAAIARNNYIDTHDTRHTKNEVAF